MSGFFDLSSIQYSWPFIVFTIMNFIELAWIVTGVFILIYYKYSERLGEKAHGCLTILKNSLRNTFLNILEIPLIAVFGYSYDRKQDMFYSNIECWQRKYGYCRLYDETAALSGMILDCEPVYFEYGGKRWLIEFWKGQYDLATGFEAGIYNTDKPDIEIPGVFNGTFYDCAQNSEMLFMSCELYKNNVLLIKDEGIHWWLTGFRVGEFSNTEELAVHIKITLKDPGMLKEFLNGLRSTGYSDADFTVDGNTVGLLFGRPRSAQPYTRTNEIEAITQWKNRLLCETYNELTSAFKSTPRKVFKVRRLDGEVYQRLKETGKSKKVFDIYNKIEKYRG